MKIMHYLIKTVLVEFVNYKLQLSSEVEITASDFVAQHKSLSA